MSGRTGSKHQSCLQDYTNSQNNAVVPMPSHGGRPSDGVKHLMINFQNKEVSHKSVCSLSAQLENKAKLETLKLKLKLPTYYTMYFWDHITSNPALSFHDCDFILFILYFEIRINLFQDGKLKKSK